MAVKPKVTSILTPNQLVAANMSAARKLRGWTQEEAAAHLAPHLGAHWSKANYSAAESSWLRQGRLRNFSADDLVAIAAAFELPIAWFFMPPPFFAFIPRANYDEENKISSAGPDSGMALDIGDYMTVVFGTPEGVQHAIRRIDDAFEHPPNRLHDLEAATASKGAVTNTVRAHMKARTADLARWRQSLTELEGLVAEAEREAATTLNLAMQQGVRPDADAEHDKHDKCDQD